MFLPQEENVFRDPTHTRATSTAHLLKYELTLLMSLPKVSLKLEPRISNWTWELEPLSLKSIVPVRPVIFP